VSGNKQNSTQSTMEFSNSKAEVINNLVRGATVTEATRQANVDRTTFYLWLRSDVNFQAELNRAKQERANATRSQMMELAETAVATVREILTNAQASASLRLKAALAVLQGIGSLKPEDIGDTDPDVLRQKAAFDVFL
jgi:ribosomal protein L22